MSWQELRHARAVAIWVTTNGQEFKAPADL
jgi:hypothetical protein